MTKRVRAVYDERSNAVRVIHRPLKGGGEEQAAFIRVADLPTWIDELTAVRSRLYEAGIGEAALQARLGE